MPITIHEEAKNHLACHLPYWVRDLDSVPNYYRAKSVDDSVFFFFSLWNVFYPLNVSVGDKVWPVFSFYNSFAILRASAADR